jgi:hydroxymethylbilane synthase
VTLRIGTRGSPLARAQADAVRRELSAAHPDLEIETVLVTTRGDKILDVPLAQVGGKGLFVKEIEDALLRGDVDLAVHSLKDVPGVVPAGLALVAFPRREDPRDVLVGRTAPTLSGLAAGARIGTSSLRRAVQLRAARPDLEIVSVRGNVGTRIDKLDRGDLDAILLARAGLARLGLEGRATEILEIETMLPAVGQGVIAIEARADDGATRSLAASLSDPATERAVAVERAFLARLEGSCQVPLAAHARETAEGTRADGFVSSLDGRRRVAASRNVAAGASLEALAEAGRSLAEELLAKGGKEILDEIG